MIVQKNELIIDFLNVNQNTLLHEIITEYKIVFISENKNRLSICFVNPSVYGFSGNIEQYNLWYVKFLEENIKVFDKYGLKDIVIFMNIFYINQCNFEIFDKKILKEITKFSVSLPISVYKLEKKEIIQMLEEEGFNKESYLDIM